MTVMYENIICLMTSTDVQSFVQKSIMDYSYRSDFPHNSKENSTTVSNRCQKNRTISVDHLLFKKPLNVKHPSLWSFGNDNKENTSDLNWKTAWIYSYWQFSFLDGSLVYISNFLYFNLHCLNFFVSVNKNLKWNNKTD